MKNTLLKLAADEAGKSDLMQIIEGPTALAISYGDVIEASKALTAYAPTAPPVSGCAAATWTAPC